jgi:hypothetical protein
MYRTTTFYANERSNARKPVRKRTEVFQRLYPVQTRMASANGNAKHAYHYHSARDAWTDYIVLAEVLTDSGWQPLDQADIFPEVFGS